MASLDSHAWNFSTLYFRNRHLLGLTIVVLLVAGLSAIGTLPRAEDPVITHRNPVIITSFPGAQARRVEALVTEKIERKLKEISEIKEVSSTSSAGVSVVSITLADQVLKGENERVFSRIRDALADARREFPPGVAEPFFDDQRRALAYTLLLAVRWTGAGEPSLPLMNRTAQDLSDHMRGVTGTALVRVFGAVQEEVQVLLEEDAILSVGLDPREVARRLALSDVKVPGGIVRGTKDRLVEIGGEFDQIARIGQTPILESEQAAIRVDDVATVQRRVADPPETIAFSDGHRAILVGSRMQEGQRVDLWAKRARKALESYRAELGAGLTIDVIFDQSTYTEAKLQELTGSLLAGAGVVVVVIFFLMGLRSALLVSTALPLVAGFTLFLLGVFDVSIHQMSIFGMIVALGLLIDNAIVMVDDVTSRLSHQSRVEAVRGAIHHLFLPLLASTLTTMLAFAPITLLPGNGGDFVGSIGTSVILALGASFFVAMTAVAALAGIFGQPRQSSHSQFWMSAWKTGVSSVWLSRLTKHWLLAAFRRPLMGITVALAPGILGFIAATQLGSQFFPPVDRDIFTFRLWASRGTSLDETLRLARELEALVREDPEVRSVHWIAGGYFPAVYYNQPQVNDRSPHYVQGIIMTGSNDATERLVPLLQAKADSRLPEAQVVMNEFGQGPPSFADLEFRLFGPDEDQLRKVGEDLRRLMQNHPHVLHTQMTLEQGQPKILWRLREDEVIQSGLSLTEVARQLESRIEGLQGGSLLEAPEELPVRVRFKNDFRESMTRFASLKLVAGSEQDFVPLDALGTADLVPEPPALSRYNSQRVNMVSGYVAAGALPLEVTREVLAQAEAQNIFPDTVRLGIGGNAQQQGEAVGNLARFLPVLVVLMVAVLILTFRSVRLAVLLGLVAIMSVGLGLLSTWSMNLPVSFTTILGIVGLIGVAINDSIVVLAAILGNEAARRGEPEAILRAVMGTMRHVLATTFTTIGGFLPLLLFVGGDFWPSLAIVLVGGIGGATLMAVLFVPAAYILIARREIPLEEQIQAS
jgi:multidrug efflux pump subunit AcrB